MKENTQYVLQVNKKRFEEEIASGQWPNTPAFLGFHYCHLCDLYAFAVNYKFDGGVVTPEPQIPETMKCGEELKAETLPSESS